MLDVETYVGGRKKGVARRSEGGVGGGSVPDCGYGPVRSTDTASSGSCKNTAIVTAVVLSL